ncbi:MAG: DUF4147 domain-containing protein [Gemmatimonadaceae bacterium]|nr:DUF4147 domain-containing protein [Gemmatimonadaceae bacterium]
MTHTADRTLLEKLFREALQQLEPAGGVKDAMDGAGLGGAPLHLIATGKASRAMSHAALAWCAAHAVPVAGGVCVTHDDPHEPDGVLRVVTGDHPVPGEYSRAAADAIGRHIEFDVQAGDDVLVLLSGGTSSLIGAPRAGIAPATYVACCTALLGAGIDIRAINVVRRRLSRWGGGRLAQALHDAGARTTVLVISDVPGDDVASIGGGPCVAESAPCSEAHACVEHAALDAAERRQLHEAIDATHVTHATFAPVPHLVLASNRIACGAVVTASISRGMDATFRSEPLAGDAHDVGTFVARAALAQAAAPDRRGATVLCWGGEPTMRVPPRAPAGGRMQALALAAAQVLHDAGEAARGITLLCAGTDGRDGATDAAGAVVTSATWRGILAQGLDPAQALAARESHTVLRAVGALVPAMTTGTNLNDVVIALVQPPR